MGDGRQRFTCAVDRPTAWDTRTPHRLSKESRTAPSQLPVPRVGCSAAVATLLSVILLVSLCAVGGGATHLPEPQLPSVGHWLLDAGTAVLRGLAKLAPGQDIESWQWLGIVVIGLAVFLAWRHFTRNRYAYLPGPVDVRDFDDATATSPGGPTARAVYLKSRFCRQLAETSVYPPYAGPADPPPQGFVDVLAKEEVDLSKPTTLLRPLARLWPTHGYQIKGTLQERTQEPRYGLSVTVTSFAGTSGSATTTEWGRSWEDATCRAAYWAMAKIVPVTRLANTSPWRKWRQRDMPFELFEAYNEAKRRHDDQRLDDALWWYREALRLDPFNVDIRMMVASVQEDLGLFLDALQTYQGALATSELEARYTGALWSRKRDRLAHPWRYTVATVRQLRHHPEWVKLRFQYARALGYSERVTQDLFRVPAGAERRQIHDQNRQRLCAALAERYWPAVLCWTEPADHDQAKSQVRAMLSDEDGAVLMLRLAAWQELHRLYEDVPLSWLVPGASTDVKRRVLRLMRDVWAPLRVMAALAARPPAEDSVGSGALSLDDAGCLSTWWIRSRRQRAAWSFDVGWPADPVRLERVIRRAQRRWRPLARLSYLDYYEAACVYAYALCGYPSWNPPRAEEEWRHGLPRRQPLPAVEELTFLAIENLRASLMCTESGRAGRLSLQSDTKAGVASRLRTWIASSEPDLERLRNRPEFRFFHQDAYLPLRPLLYRPSNVTTVRTIAYARALATDGAALLYEEWHARSLRTGSIDIEELVGWVRLDQRTWAMLRQIAEDGALHWANRQGFARLVTEAVALMTTAERNFPPPVPIFEDLVIRDLAALSDETEDPTTEVDESIRRHVQEVTWSLGSVAAFIAEIDQEAVRHGRADLSSLAARGLPPAEEETRRICTTRAGWWWRVVELLRTAEPRVETVDPSAEQTEP